MEIEIIPIQTRFDTVYIVHGDGTILIDGGDPHKMAKVKLGIEKASINPKDIQLIVLTHGHWDHIGSVGDIKDFTSAKVLLHQKDMHLLDDTPPSQPPGFTLWGKFIIALLKVATRSLHIPLFDVEIALGDEEFSLVNYGIPGSVVHTPGHSWGSVSVVLVSGEAFVGDLAMNMAPMRFSPGLPIFGDDMQIVKKSWRKLKSMGVRTVFPAHGKPFPADIIYRSLE